MCEPADGDNYTYPLSGEKLQVAPNAYRQEIEIRDIRRRVEVLEGLEFELFALRARVEVLEAARRRAEA